MNANFPKIKLVVNTAIILVALLLCGLLVRKLYFDQRPEYGYRIVPQARLTIEGVDWAQSDQTLLVALAKNCRFCTESAPFYRRLLQGLAEQTNTRVIALFPERQPPVDTYLNDLGVSVGELRYVSLASLGIKDVPTLVLLDSKGLVTNMWVGKLPPRTESEVMEALKLKETRPHSDWLIDEKILRLRIVNQEPIIVVDVRDRAAFSTRQEDGARNIPVDELQVRAINELPPDHTVVLYGHYDADTDMAYRILDEQGFTKILILARTPSK